MGVRSEDGTSLITYGVARLDYSLIPYGGAKERRGLLTLFSFLGFF